MAFAGQRDGSRVLGQCVEPWKDGGACSPDGEGGAAQAVTARVLFQAGVRPGVAQEPGLRKGAFKVQRKKKHWEAGEPRGGLANQELSWG